MSRKLLAEIEAALQAIRKGARFQRKLSTSQKNSALQLLAERVLAAEAKIIEANKIDLKNLSADTLPSFRDRLMLDSKRIALMAEGLRQVANLADPVGEVVEERTLQNGLKTRRERSPLGVIFMIFESRPNVILEAFSLAFKSGNSILLRGGSDSKETSAIIYALMAKALADAKIDWPSFYGIQDYDRAHVETLLTRKDIIDIVVPRGSERLIEFVQKNSHMPIIKNDRGLCHTYVDEDADLNMAVEIVNNGKVQRPGVCNSLETVLVHSKVAEKFIDMLYAKTNAVNLKWHVDEASNEILSGKARVTPAKKEDWDTEYLDLILNCKVVASLDEALEHIDRHSSKHSEAIVTSSETKARRFQEEVDAAAVYWNASTRFTDGFEMGLGGELGISTQKLHVRGPVGLRELTTPRWIIDGTGQIR